MKLKTKIELLAPVGGPEQLHAAVNFGADAVYLAAENFGMRAKAQNFDEKSLKAAVKFSHEKSVKVYVTCNILMHDENLIELRPFLKKIEKAGVDAVIVGDLGALALAREIAPKLDIHVSTQASVANTRAAIEYAKLGAKRIILAREMSLDEIEKMRKGLDKAGYKCSPDNSRSVQLEAFVHGAMCMSISGRCLISSYLTGRSANKGLCTQPCRWGYSLLEEKRPGQNFEIGEDGFGTFIMNSKDMNMLAHLEKLQKAGISSIKIEGRNKKALYVATTVNAYRHVLDAIDEGSAKFEDTLKKWAPELDNVSHRPYSTGFYFGEAQQSPTYDGYEQNCIHVADVIENDLSDKTRTVVFCRNHFEEGETLEALIPGGDIKSFKIENLLWHPTCASSGKSVDVANRAKEFYSFKTNAALPAGSLIRSKTFLRTSR